MYRWTPVALMAALACATTLDPAIAEAPIEEPMIDYDRKLWKHWIDADGDCQDTRQEVLIRESTVPVTYTDEKECRVATGSWTGAYTGTVITDPSKVDVDHVVALSDAHESGGWRWGDEAREAFANDLSDPKFLTATSQFGNRSKKDKGPDEWLPPLETYRCAYIERWVSIKEGAELSMAEGETAVIGYMRHICEAGGTPPLPQN